jgi:hypothetical protein
MFIVTGANGRCAHHHRLQTGAADLVDGRRADAVGEAGLQRGLASRRLPGARLQNLAHDRLVDHCRVDARALDGGTDGDTAKLDGRGGRQPAAELADGRPGGREDVHVTHVVMVPRRAPGHDRRREIEPARGLQAPDY